MKNLYRIAVVFLLVWTASRTAVYLLPGDPAEFLVHDSLVQLEPSELRKKMDLDRPLIERIFSLPQNESLVLKEKTSTLVLRASIHTFILSLLSLLFALPSTLGLLYLHFLRGWKRRASEFSTQMITSVPVIVLGPLLLRNSSIPNPWLPAIALSVSMTAFWYRALSRKLEAMIPTSSVTGARALGYPEFRVFYRNLLAPGFGSFVAYFGTQLGILFNGSLLVETIFQWNGLGSLMTNSVLSRDYPVIELCLMIAAILTLVSQQLGYELQKAWEPKLK